MSADAGDPGRQKEELVRSLAAFSAQDDPAWRAILGALESAGERLREASGARRDSGGIGEASDKATAGAWLALRDRLSALMERVSPDVYGGSLSAALAELERSLPAETAPGAMLEEFERAVTRAESLLSAPLPRPDRALSRLRREASSALRRAEALGDPDLAAQLARFERSDPGDGEDAARWAVDARRALDAAAQRLDGRRIQAVRPLAEARENLRGEIETALERAPVEALGEAREVADQLRRAERAGTSVSVAGLLESAGRAAAALREVPVRPSENGERVPAPAVGRPVDRTAETALRMRAHALLDAGHRSLADPAAGHETGGHPGKGSAAAKRGAALAESVRALEEAFRGTDAALLEKRADDLAKRLPSVPKGGHERRLRWAALAALTCALALLVTVIATRGSSRQAVRLTLDETATRSVTVRLVARDGKPAGERAIARGERELRLELPPGVYELFVDGSYTGRAVIVPGPDEVALGPAIRTDAPSESGDAR